MRVNASLVFPGALCKRPLSKPKCEKRPDDRVYAPPIYFLRQTPVTELASHVRVGGGAVFETGKGMLDIGKLTCW